MGTLYSNKKRANIIGFWWKKESLKQSFTKIQQAVCCGKKYQLLNEN